jgi:hypothetical protein
MRYSGLFYLATPYTKYSLGIEEAYKAACAQTALLLEAGIPIFCPIAHTHGPAIVGKIDPSINNTLWIKLDQEFINVCRAVIVCKLGGWDQSIGVRMEIDEFERQGKPVVFMEPGIIPKDGMLRA